MTDPKQTNDSESFDLKKANEIDDIKAVINNALIAKSKEVGGIPNDNVIIALRMVLLESIMGIDSIVAWAECDNDTSISINLDSRIATPLGIFNAKVVVEFTKFKHNKSKLN